MKHVLKYICLIIIIILLTLLMINCNEYSNAISLIIGALLSILVSFIFEDYKYWQRYKYWKDNELFLYRDLLEIFSKIISELALSINLIDTAHRVNVGYSRLEEILNINSNLNNVLHSQNSISIDFKYFMESCHMDFNNLKNNYFSLISLYCIDEDVKFHFSFLVTHINQFYRNYHSLEQLTKKMNIIEIKNKLKSFINIIMFHKFFELNYDNEIINIPQYNELVENVHFQYLNISDSITILYKKMFPIVEKRLQNN